MCRGNLHTLCHIIVTVTVVVKIFFLKHWGFYDEKLDGERSVPVCEVKILRQFLCYVVTV